MRNLILIVHTSLDGYVAGPNGELDYFENAEENLEFVCELTEGADAALFGRVSYELLNKYWPTAAQHPGATKGEVMYSNWYNKARKIVISRSIAGKQLENTTIIDDHIPETIAKIKNQAGRDILMFGSPSVSKILIQHRLIDSYWICINPMLFGQGIPLFTASSQKIKFKLVKTKQFANGELAINYIDDSRS